MLAQNSPVGVMTPCNFNFEGEIIKDIRFMTDGCGATIACGSMLTKMAKTKSLSEARKITPNDLLAKLVSIPEDHEHCLSLAVYTLRLTIEDAQKKLNEDSGNL